MQDHDNTCTACFPTGSRPDCRVFDNSSGALTIYSSLHASGKEPSMCMQADQRYRVCHLREKTATVHRGSGVRAA